MNTKNQQQQRPFEVNLRIPGKFQKVTVLASSQAEAVERATAAHLGGGNPEEMIMNTTPPAVAYPVVPDTPGFFITAASEIRSHSRIIYPGEYVFIDPNTKPENGKMVLAGNCLEPWNGQPKIRGVAVAIYSDET